MSIVSVVFGGENRNDRFQTFKKDRNLTNFLDELVKTIVYFENHPFLNINDSFFRLTEISMYIFYYNKKRHMKKFFISGEK